MIPEPFSDRASARVLHDIAWWRDVITIDWSWFYFGVERHGWHTRGVLSLLPDSRCWGFAWGDHGLVPLDDVPPSEATR